VKDNLFILILFGCIGAFFGGPIGAMLGFFLGIVGLVQKGISKPSQERPDTSIIPSITEKYAADQTHKERQEESKFKKISKSLDINNDLENIAKKVRINQLVSSLETKPDVIPSITPKKTVEHEQTTEPDLETEKNLKTVIRECVAEINVPYIVNFINHNGILRPDTSIAPSERQKEVKLKEPLEIKPNTRTSTNTKIICLANSKKYGDRCVAGIEVKETEYVFEIVQEGSKNKWIRPVSHSGYGEFPTMIAQNIKLLDVVELEIKEYCPSGYQSENAYFTDSSVKHVSSIQLSSTNLDQLTSECSLLFGNRGKAVSADMIDELSYSLLLIKAESFKPYIKQENNQLRMQFAFKQTQYDFPITDIQFEKLFRNNQNILNGISRLYLTISLAVEYNGWHTKLIAGVIYI
jgi:hypothetical protein